jgi:NADPH:quinone reductase-like Zn-dependent oxidoreductase
VQGNIVCWFRTSPDASIGVIRSAVLALAHLVQRLAGTDYRLHLVTEGASWGHDSDKSVNFAGAAVLALGRCIASENSNVVGAIIDLEPDLPLDTAVERIAADLDCDSAEEISWRGQERFEQRLTPWPLAELPQKTLPVNECSGFALTVAQPGSIGGLRWLPRPLPEPGARQVTLAVEAVGVNFRDVLKTLDLYPLEGFEWRWLGDECAGTVIATGHEVEHLKPGDAVVAIAPDCMASSVVADARLVCKRPGSITVDEAAGVPIAFLTAWYSLVECARLQAGETVLIHAGAGGVGQAAVQIASHLGARVLATASPEKHGIVRALGADAVFNSRDLSFPDAVRKATEGAGVDVVLNSLAGHALRYGLDLLRPFGRFIEIGKRDIYANNSVDLRSLRDNRSFRSVDLASWLKCCPDAAGERLSEILKMLDAGKLRPISDHVSPISAASETFRAMSQGRHTGKLVLDARPGAAPARVVDRAPVLVRQEGSYLITGGTSGFGLHVAGFLAEAGASHLVLASQTGRIRAEDEPRVAAIRALGAAVSVRACDVVERGEVADLLSEIRTAGPKLRGIVHGAMVLDDVDVLHLDAERLDRVMGPKVVGAWHLDEASERDPLDWFLLQGSVSAMMGASGQANYVVANHLLAALAADRRRRGLPAQLIAWGPLAGNGVVARSDRLRRYFELIGFPLLTEQAADEALGQVLRSDVEAPGIFELDWSRFAASAPDRARSRRFLHLREGAAQSTNPGGAGGDDCRGVAEPPPADSRRTGCGSGRVGAWAGCERCPTGSGAWRARDRFADGRRALNRLGGDPRPSLAGNSVAGRTDPGRADGPYRPHVLGYGGKVVALCGGRART